MSIENPRFAVCVALMLVALVHSAADAVEQKKGGALPGVVETRPEKVENVKTILDRPAEFAKKDVRISGEVGRKIDERTFVLESGGGVGNEMLVIADRSITKDKLNVTKRGDVVEIVGRVFVGGAKELERAIGYSPDPKVAANLGDRTAYLVADDIRERSDR